MTAAAIAAVTPAQYLTELKRQCTKERSTPLGRQVMVEVLPTFGHPALAHVFVDAMAAWGDVAYVREFTLNTHGRVAGFAPGLRMLHNLVSLRIVGPFAPGSHAQAAARMAQQARRLSPRSSSTPQAAAVMNLLQEEGNTGDDAKAVPKASDKDAQGNRLMAVSSATKLLQALASTSMGRLKHFIITGLTTQLSEEESEGMALAMAACVRKFDATLSVVDLSYHGLHPASLAHIRDM